MWISLFTGLVKYEPCLRYEIIYVSIKYKKSDKTCFNSAVEIIAAATLKFIPPPRRDESTFCRQNAGEEDRVIGSHPQAV